ncbi:MAG: RluA family pseudouridine synthase [Bacteroidales bacterium]|nr:RluA family pseudouridine synthase [Bacteroidales bacterium]
MYFFTENRIIYEDNHILAINKLAGELVQSDAKGDISLEEIVKLYIKEKNSKPGNVFLGVVHRLDRPVSGLLLFAKTSKSLARFNKMQQERKIKKLYIALTLEAPPVKTGVLKNYIIKAPNKNISKIVSESNKNAKLAILEYEIIPGNGIYIWKINLITGRHHQIRCQLAHIGCPILNDVKYGFKKSYKTDKIYLHSYSMEFTHPVKKENMKLTAPLPTDDEMWLRVEKFIYP